MPRGSCKTNTIRRRAIPRTLAIVYLEGSAMAPISSSRGASRTTGRAARGEGTGMEAYIVSHNPSNLVNSSRSTVPPASVSNNAHTASKVSRMLATSTEPSRRRNVLIMARNTSTLESALEPSSSQYLNLRWSAGDSRDETCDIHKGELNAWESEVHSKSSDVKETQNRCHKSFKNQSRGFFFKSGGLTSTSAEG
jgi:hypothetical protein